MMGRPILKVEPLPDGLIRGLFDTGNSVTVNMKPRFSGARFAVLRKPEIWWSADTDGTFIHWYRDHLAVAELAYDEIMKMTLGESY